MNDFMCTVCGYIYDTNEGNDEAGVEPGTEFQDLPEDWACPVCGAARDEFLKET
ncbi:MAG: rubredoxin [Deltaproteobacteria bacterium]|uniref:Rubredoxin n=1 Tax=Candidatus Zymogenus saltonus TaxID=2844893 RepID=A0A9D8PND6_9DELT|nr:rubredoxin [Candidatus Zymogenus saltonus]